MQLCQDPFHDSRSYPEGLGVPGLGEPPRGSSIPQSTNGEAIQTLQIYNTPKILDMRVKNLKSFNFLLAEFTFGVL